MFHVQYHQGPSYRNQKLTVRIKDSDRIADFRKVVQEQYGLDESSYVIAWVIDNKVAGLYNSH